MRRTRSVLLSFVALLMLCAGNLRADIIIDGDDAFQAAVNDCINMINGVGGDSAAVLKCLESSGKDHKITQNKGSNNTTYDNTNDANSPAAGGTGNGSGSTVHWDPNLKGKFSDGVERDPCASLFHELVHAKDGDQGMRDPRTDVPGNNGIKANEVKATAAENKYRKAKGLPIRTKYGDKDLPASAIPTASDMHEGGLINAQ